MPHVFLSDEWFSEVARLRAEAGDLGLAPDVLQLVVNLEVSGGPHGTVEARLSAGALERGFSDHACAKLRLAYPLAARVLLTQDQSGLVSAYLSGELRIEGDFGPLLTLQRSAQSGASRALLERIARITA